MFVIEDELMLCSKATMGHLIGGRLQKSRHLRIFAFYKNGLRSCNLTNLSFYISSRVDITPSCPFLIVFKTPSTVVW